MYKKLTKTFLIKEYINKRQKTATIAKMVGCDKSTVLLKLKKYSIPIRSCNSIKEDITDNQYYKLKVIKKIKTHKQYGRTQWLCKCECGNERICIYTKLVNKKIKACYKCCMKRKNGIHHHSWSRGKYISGAIFGKIKTGAKERKIYFDLNIEYLELLLEKQNFKCALSGIELILPKTNLDNYTISLDRIDSSKGYIKGNVQWVHKWVNYMKVDFDEKEFIEFCIMIANYSGTKYK